MRALIVATDPERLRALRTPLEAAGTECSVVESWAAASPRLVASPRPELVVADFDLLVHDGLNSLLAADAQLKVLRIPTLLAYDRARGRDVEAVRALVHFGRVSALPSNDIDLTRAYNALVPSVAAVTPTRAPMQSYADLAAAAFAPVDAALPAGTRVDGRYEIERLVETGGMGQIYRARQQPLGRPVALKVIRSDLARDTDAVARFQLEARTISRLNHPNTIVLFDYGIDETPHPGRNDDTGGLMYLAMEWLDGKTLEQLQETSGQLAPARAVRIASQVAHSLAEAHDKAIVHRDLKPSNIFVLAGDFVKVLDFGIAKLVDTPQSHAITRVGAICGTPEYMSPEQARGDELDGRSDLYALGCVLYCMLAGHPPYMHEQPLQVIIAHQTMPPPDLEIDGVPQVLREVVSVLMAKKPNARLASAAQLAEILDQLDRGHEAQARALLEATLRRNTAGDENRLAGAFTGSASQPARAKRSTTVSSDSAAQLLDDDDLFGTSDDDDDLFGTGGDDEFELLNPFAAEPPAALDELEIPWPELGCGRLSEVSMPRWLHLASRRGLSGTLTVTRNRLNQSAQLRNGQLVRTPGTRLEALLGTFAWSDGEYTLVETPAGGDGEPVPMLPFIFEGIRLHTSVNSVAAELVRDNERYPVVTSLYAEQSEACAGLEAVSALAALCTGQRTLGELMMSAGLGFEAVCRALTLLLSVDAVRLVDTPTTAPLPVRYARIDAHDDALARPQNSLAPADQLLMTRIERFLEQFAAGRLHEAFDLEPGCGPDAVHSAYTRFTRDYAEGRLRRKSGPIAALAGKLHDEARAALTKLLDDEEPAPLNAREQQVLNELEAAHTRFAAPDAHAAFGLAAGCGSRAVDDVYFKLANQYHPDHYAAHDRPEIKRTANDVFIALQEAYQRLLASEPEAEAEPVRPPPGKPAPPTVAAPVSAPVPAAPPPAQPSPARPATAQASPPPSQGPSEAQTSRYRIAPPRRPTRTSPDMAAQPAPGPVAPRAVTTSSQPLPKITTPAPRTTSPAPSTRTPASAPANSNAPAGDASQAPRQRKMSEILAERAARQAAATTVSQPAAAAPAAAVAAQPLVASTKSAIETFRIGERHLARQQHDQALAAFEAAAHAEPDNGQHCAFLAWTRHLCDASSLDDTQTALKNARKMDQGYVSATYFLGKLALQQQDLSAARGYFEAVLSKNPRHVDAQRELRLVRGRLEEASQGGLLGRLARKLRGDS